MGDVAFVDTHIHFWERPHPVLKWSWLEPDFVHPLLSDIDQLKKLSSYSADHFASETKDSNVTKAVHIQAAIGTEDFVEETKWLSKMAEALVR